MAAPHDDEAITTYSMHVSAKYLELTKKKLELTRLPRELELPNERRWGQGTPKSVLEPLLDFWLEGYDWRAAESRFNSTLPQYRTTITVPLSPLLPLPNRYAYTLYTNDPSTPTPSLYFSATHGLLRS